MPVAAETTTSEERPHFARQFRRNHHYEKLLRWRETAPAVFNRLSLGTRTALRLYEERREAHRQELENRIRS